MNRVLITGHAGFTGGHLVRELEASGYLVVGFDQSDGDIRNATAIRRCVQGSRPQVVFHLAAKLKSDDPQDLYSVNVLGTVALLDALETLAAPPTVVVVSSSAVYGRTGGDRPIDERAATRPVTHYGTSKLAQELVAMRYARARRLRVIRARTFNLLGPGLPATLACGAFAAAVARLERLDEPEPLPTGTLTTARDFTDIRDVVRAYRLLAEHGRAGQVYNVCSGTAVSLQACLGVLLGLARRRIATTVDPDRVQVDDLPVQVGSFARTQATVGWAPAISVRQSLADMLDYARAGGRG